MTNLHILYFTVLSCILITPLKAQEPIAQQVDFNIRLLSNRQIDFPSETNSQYHRYSDIWGYVALDGTEYAILGTGVGTAIYQLSDPSEPELVALIPGAPSRWRDYKSYGEYIFGVADEGADGLLIADMSNAPDDITWSFWKPSLTIDGDQAHTLDKCHNLYIDSTYVFLSGCNLYGGGIIILDLSENPEEPIFLSTGDRKYAHDVFVQDNFMFTSDLGQGFAVVDISDINQPNTLVTQETSFDFTHNAWASTDNNYLFTTDERVGAMVDAYDIRNLDELVLLDRYRPTATLRNGVIPHNVHYFNGYLVVSYYIDGVKIIDAHDPTNLVEVGSYDTYKFRDDGFHGAWGAYPFLPSGLLLVSDIESGLYVLDPDYQRAAYLSGTVSDVSSGAALSGVTVEILSEKPGLTTTDASGDFSTGWAGMGMATVTFQKLGYHSQSLEINLTQAETTELDVALEPLEQRFVSGVVLDRDTGQPLSGAQVILYNDAYETKAITDADGLFQMQVLEGAYILAAGSWGYIHDFEEVDLAADATNLQLQLAPGYRDDFIFDFGWTVDNSVNTSSAQGWERGNPRYAIYNEELTNPNGDLPGDLGNSCFVTGLAGTLGANLADTSVLTSPLFDLSLYGDPYINYFTWFYDYGVLDSDDDLKIYLGNGQDEVLIETLENSASGWREQSQIRILDFLNLTSEMYLKVVAADAGNIHIYESAIDAFSITEGQTTGVEEKGNYSLTIYPNPSQSIINWKVPGHQSIDISIYDLQGKLQIRKLNTTQTFISIDQLLPGTYILASAVNGRFLGSQKFVKY
ncbi:MAG: choice-of-anchor B family protein [Saprospiraceae bacterium]|nr:choice-of-anchor B family protein [Saprospiraceae bacterium]